MFTFFNFNTNYSTIDQRISASTGEEYIKAKILKSSTDIADTILKGVFDLERWICEFDKDSQSFLKKDNQLKSIITEMIVINYEKFSSFNQNDQRFFIDYMIGWVFLKRDKQDTNETIQREISQLVTVAINLLYDFKNKKLSIPQLMEEKILLNHKVAIVKRMVDKIIERIELKKEGYKFSLDLEVQIRNLLRQSLQTSKLILPKIEYILKSKKMDIKVLVKYPVGRFFLIETLGDVLETILNVNISCSKLDKKSLEALNDGINETLENLTFKIDTSEESNPTYHYGEVFKKVFAVYEITFAKTCPVPDQQQLENVQNVSNNIMDLNNNNGKSEMETPAANVKIQSSSNPPVNSSWNINSLRRRGSTLYNNTGLRGQSIPKRHKNDQMESISVRQEIKPKEEKGSISVGMKLTVFEKIKRDIKRLEQRKNDILPLFLHQKKQLDLVDRYQMGGWIFDLAEEILKNIEKTNPPLKQEEKAILREEVSAYLDKLRQELKLTAFETLESLKEAEQNYLDLPLAEQKQLAKHGLMEWMTTIAKELLEIPKTNQQPPMASENQKEPKALAQKILKPREYETLKEIIKGYLKQLREETADERNQACTSRLQR